MKKKNIEKKMEENLKIILARGADTNNLWESYKNKASKKEMKKLQKRISKKYEKKFEKTFDVDTFSDHNL